LQHEDACYIRTTVKYGPASIGERPRRPSASSALPGGGVLHLPIGLAMGNQGYMLYLPDRVTITVGFPQQVGA
jgi:hypothetical protein